MNAPAWWNRVVEHVNAYQLANPQNLPGAVCAAETEQDGRLLASVGQGWASDTICEIGSMGKPFVATAALMALEEHDLLDIERPVWQLPGMELYAADPVKRQIRLRHLLQHTSGLPNVQPYSEGPSTPCNDPAGGPPCCAGARLNLGPTVPWLGAPGYTNECIHVEGRCQPARESSLDQVSSYVMRTYAPTHQPGAQFSYSTANYIVVGRIVEELSGKSINRYLKEKLLEPLGMRDSFFVAQKTGDAGVDARIEEGVTEEQRRRIADLTVITQTGELPPDLAPGPDGSWDKYRQGWRYVSPEGGLYSTAEDLLQFLGMLRDGGRSGGRVVLSPAVVSLLVDDQGFDHTMGFGYRDDVNAYGQGKGTLVHLGRNMTYFWYDPRRGNEFIGIFLSQRMIDVNDNVDMKNGMSVIFRVFVRLAYQP